MASIEGRSEDSPADFAKQLYGGGTNAELRRELWEAVFQYDRALELTPLFDAFEARAAALYALGWRGEAIADYTRALDLRQDSLVYLERGQVFLEMNQYGAAEADFLRALELDLPDSDLRDAYIGLGDAHRNLGALEAAISDYSIAIRMDPDNWSPYYWRGVSLVGLQRFPAALDDFSRVIAQRPLGTSAAYYARGVLNWMNGQCELARDDLTVFGNLNFDKELLARARFTSSTSAVRPGATHRRRTYPSSSKISSQSSTRRLENAMQTQRNKNNQALRGEGLAWHRMLDT